MTQPVQDDQDDQDEPGGGGDEAIVKTGYFLRARHRDWLRTQAYQRGVTASQVLREILDRALPVPVGGTFEPRQGDG